MKIDFFLILILTSFTMSSQNQLPFKEIPPIPNSYEAGNIVSRMIDGLGYRFYWASDSLTEKDLAYRPSTSGKTSLETLQHLFDLSVTIKNVSEKTINIRPYVKLDLNYKELRNQTLNNLEIARTNFLSKTSTQLELFKVIFQNGENKSEYPLWNCINGPIADAIYHTGQLVIFRRATGNPLNSKVRVFTGINAE